MTQVAVQLGGQTVNTPGAYYQDNVSGTDTPIIGTLPPLLFIGNSFGGAPQTIIKFATLQQGQILMRNGPAAAFLPFMYNPSTQVNGCSQVTFINCSRNTAATLLLANTTPTTALTFTTGDYGLPSNLMRLQLTADAITGVAVTVNDQFGNVTAVQNGVEYPLIFQYTGAATTGITYVVAGTQGNATSITFSSGVSGETFVVNLGPAAHATMAQVAATINGSAFPWRCYVNSMPNMPSQLLDVKTGTFVTELSSASIAVFGAGFYVGGATLYNGLWYWANNLTNGMITAVITDSSTPVGFAPTQWLPFTGGTNVPPVSSDYANALNLALTTPAWVVFCDSNSTTVQALLEQHVQTASSIPYRRFRRGVTGASGPSGITMQQAIAAAVGMNTKEMTFCYPGIYRTDTNTGVNTLYDALYLAACVAGIMCGNDPSLALTNKTINCTGLEFDLDPFLDVGLLQDGGVLCAYLPDSSGVATLAADVTTWQNDTNPENEFNQQVANRQFFAYGFIQAMSPYTGTIAYGLSLVIQKNAAKNFLNSQVRGVNNNGVLASWDPTTLVLNYNSNQQLVSVSVNQVFVGEVLFTLITTDVLPLNITA